MGGDFSCFCGAIICVRGKMVTPDVELEVNFTCGHFFIG